MILETDRLILRPWKEADAEECFRYASDPAVGPMAGWPPHADREETQRVIRDVLSVPENYAVVWKETGLPVGSAGIALRGGLVRGEKEGELGYWVGKPYWGRGIAPEASRVLLQHAFEDLGLERVWCGYFEGNRKSEKVQRKVGFRHVRTDEDVDVPQLGEKRRLHVSCMTREEWLENGRIVP